VTNLVYAWRAAMTYQRVGAERAEGREVY
jgi:hypothetical protein